MDTRTTLTGNGWIQHKKRRSLDYSRYLCGSTRSTTLIAKRPSKSLSDTDVVGVLRQLKTHRPCDGFNKRIDGQTSVERTPQQQVYHMDKTFHRKYGSKNERTEIFASSPATHLSWIDSPTISVNFDANDDDCARSFCDAVSSIASSNFANSDVKKQMERNVLTDKSRVAKFNDIESWLQRLSSPVLQA